MNRLLSVALVCIAASTLPACAQSPKPSQPNKNRSQAPASPHYGQRADALRWADALAQQQGLDAGWLRQQLTQAKQLEQVRRLMTPSTAPKKATARSWANYRSRFIDPVRIRAGLRFWQENAAALERAQQTYGVPPEIIVGIIGVETVYGRNMGSFRVLDALATLAFDYPPSHPRVAERAAYFQGELAQFLTTAWSSKQDPTQTLGSYAGAMGLGQFMPSSLARFGVDFDGDGKVDLNHSTTDAIGSVANYFRGHGWVPDMPVQYGVTFKPEGADMATLLGPDIKPTFTAEQLLQLGAVPLDGGMQHQGPLALVELLNGADAPSYVIGTQNFYAITRYNQSSYYAMAVYELGQEVAAALRDAQATESAEPAPTTQTTSPRNAQ
ncbi:lytic murein transglycosylase B [Comamonas sp. GB3 AK4-5]|uniref:lytic murein transglycosylase B n=1 Tax=Comamonas sp. GB3 AK4-5 TaxID=3231487 RepID=UPI00351F7838